MRISLRKLVLSIMPVAAVFAMSPVAHADLLVDPYIGYGIGSTKTEGVSYKASDKGPLLGARLGVAFPLIWVAADAAYMAGSTDPDGAGPTYNLNATMIGLTAGVKVPFIRGYVGYLFKNDWKYDSGGGSNTFMGNGIKVGASFTGLPLVALNLEYLMSSFDKVKYSNGSEETVGGGHTFTKANENMVMITVSCPLMF